VIERVTEREKQRQTGRQIYIERRGNRVIQRVKERERERHAGRQIYI